MKTVNRITSSFSIGRYTPKITFDFLFCKLLVYSDGFARTDNNRKINGDYIHTVLRIGVIGAHAQPEFPELGYNLQSDFIRKFANAEHAALHLWLAVARDDSFLRDAESTRESRKQLYSELETVSGVYEDALEESFISNIQLIANGVQPDEQRTGELETSTAFLGLQATAIASALAFVSFFRAQLSKHFDKRETSNTAQHVNN
jgi:hypothetical protein